MKKCPLFVVVFALFTGSANSTVSSGVVVSSGLKDEKANTSVAGKTVQVEKTYHDVNLGDSTGLATAVSNYGTLRNSASASGSGFFPYTDVNAGAKFTDSFIIESTGKSGQGGVVAIPISFKFDIARSRTYIYDSAGGLFFNSQGQSLASFARSVTGSYDSRGLDKPLVFYASNNAVVSPFDTQFVVNVPFIFGERVFINIGLSSSLGATFGPFSGSTEDSLEWGGFGSITSAQGLVSQYSVRSASGTDWRVSQITAVPEPTSFAMLLLGLAVIGGLRTGVTVRRGQGAEGRWAPETSSGSQRASPAPRV